MIKYIKTQPEPVKGLLKVVMRAVHFLFNPPHLEHLCGRDEGDPVAGLLKLQLQLMPVSAGALIVFACPGCVLQMICSGRPLPISLAANTEILIKLNLL